MSEDSDSLFRLDAFREWEVQHFIDEGDSDEAPEIEKLPVRVDVDVRQLASEFFFTNTLLDYLRYNSFFYFLIAIVHYWLRNWLF